MKYRKLLVLALPLLLVISACNSSGSKGGESEVDSVYSEPTSSEVPHSEFSEEPLPEKTPEELEEEARTNFATFTNLFANGDYYIQVESEGIAYTLYHYIADGYVTMSQRVTAEDNRIDTFLLAGYMANSHGVMRVRSRYTSSDYRAYPTGYVSKCSYEAAKQYVNSTAKRMPFSADKWEYIANYNGSAAFKSSDPEVIRTYIYYEYGANIEKDYDVIYASINNSSSRLVLSAETNTPGMTSYMYVVDLKVEEYLNRGSRVTRGDSYTDDYRSRQLAEILKKYRTIEISDDSWHRYEDVNAPYDYVPFPTSGNRYYFIDPDYEDLSQYSNNTYARFGFIDTGDITTAYAAQLLENGYQLVTGETSVFYSSAYSQTVKLVYTPANQLSRPDIYTQGIFDIIATR